MKTLNISDEQYEFLSKLVETLATQDNRSTQYPLFVIQVQEKVYGDSSWCTEKERNGDNDGELCEACTQLDEDGEELPDDCQKCDRDCFNWFNWKDDYDLNAGVFLTAEACERHIKMNHYHYCEPKSFGISAWRNPEMQDLIKILFTIMGKEIPSHYK